MLYLHGGGYTAGGLDYAKGFGALLAAQTNLNVFCAAYRLAPEHRYPAATDDAYAAYQYLLDQGYAPEHIALAGESAGGGLVLSLALRLRERGKADARVRRGHLSLGGPHAFGASYRNNILRDPSLIRESLAYYVIAYAAGHEYEPVRFARVRRLYGLSAVPALCRRRRDFAFGLEDRVSAYAPRGRGKRACDRRRHCHVYPLYGTPEGKHAIEKMSTFIRVNLGLND